MDARYKTHFSSRNVILRYTYDLDALAEIHNYCKALESTRFIHLLELPDIIYLNLVSIFYANATSKEVEEDVDEVPWRELIREVAYITIYIFDKVIRITP